MGSRKAIIVAAGRGRRLGKETDERPKCMVEVGGRSILDWQVEALIAAGVDDVVVVRGYLGHCINSSRLRLRFVDNADWQNNNILASLMMAMDEFADGFLFSYSDIVYGASTTRALVARADRPGIDAALIVDRQWQQVYQGRTLHPIEEAELTATARIGADERVSRVGKRAVPQAAAVGEFIGLAHVSAAGGKALRDVWQAALAAGGAEAPYGTAPRLRQAYLTDGLNAMIERGCHLAPVYIDGGWREIDTEQDLERAAQAAPRW